MVCYTVFHVWTFIHSFIDSVSHWFIWTMNWFIRWKPGKNLTWHWVGSFQNFHCIQTIHTKSYSIDKLKYKFSSGKIINYQNKHLLWFNVFNCYLIFKLVINLFIFHSRFSLWDVRSETWNHIHFVKVKTNFFIAFLFSFKCCKF